MHWVAGVHLAQQQISFIDAKVGKLPSSKFWSHI